MRGAGPDERRHEPPLHVLPPASRAKGWPVVGLDVGNIAKGFGKQAELKFQIAVNAMSEMKYNAVTLGPTDLRLPAAEVMALTMPAGRRTRRCSSAATSACSNSTKHSCRGRN